MKKSFNEIDEVNAVLHSNISNLESKKVTLKSEFDKEEQRKRSELEPAIKHMLDQIAAVEEELQDGTRTILNEVNDNEYLE